MMNISFNYVINKECCVFMISFNQRKIPFIKDLLNVLIVTSELAYSQKYNLIL